jgi:hypothetical protein
MNKTKWTTIGIALVLALVLLWAVPVLAQMHGRGHWGQGSQGWGCAQGQGYGQGYGPGYANCPYNQGYRNSQGNWRNYPQANMGPRGPRGGGRNYQPNTQPVPPVTQ